MTTVLTIKDLHKSFNIGFIPKKRKILKGISLSVEQGEIFGYLGPNGAGKTTTIKCILGLILPQKGKIEIFGNPHLALKAKEKIGFLPENPYFYDHLTASEFLDFYSQLYVMDKNKKPSSACRLRAISRPSASKILSWNDAEDWPGSGSPQ